MASSKTVPSEESAEAFIAAVPDDARREDAQKLCDLLAAWTGEPPVLWGTSIVGFGCYRCRYDSGHQGTAALGFSPRKANLVLYLVGGVQDRYPKLLSSLVRTRLGRVAFTSNVLTTLTTRCSTHWSSGPSEFTAAPTDEPATALDLA